MSIIQTEFLFTITAALAEAIFIGETPRGLRRFVPIVGGVVSGPTLNGSILALGGDWQIAVSDTLLEVDARYFISTAEGVTIAVYNRGIRQAPPAVMARLTSGELVPTEEYYFRTSPRFEAPADSSYSWMNECAFVATAQRETRAAIIHVHRLL